MNKEERVNKLMSSLPKNKDIILVGSSMGGYVAAKIAKTITLSGLFLMAPA